MALAIVFTCFTVLDIKPVKAVDTVTVTSSEVKLTDLTKSESFRKKPPILPPPRPLQMPKVMSFKLDNGLEVRLVENKQVPFITALMGIKCGSANDTLEKLGLADLTAQMITEGANKKNSKELAKQIDFIGGSISAGTNADFTIISASALSKYSKQLFDLLACVVINPTFPDDELALKKTNLIQELELKRSEPDFLVEERFNKVVYGNHPYSVVAPKPETIQKITKLNLEEFHHKHYVPNESVLIVVGDFDSTKLKEILTSYFSSKDWKARKVTPKHLNPVIEPKEERIYLVDRPGSVQSSIRLGNVGIERKDKNYFSFLVANEILGGSSRSRLFLNIREQKGFTYGAYSHMITHKSAGDFVAYAEVRNKVTAPSLQEFMYELERIRNVKVGSSELTDAKNHLVGTFQLAVESQYGLASKLLDIALYDLPETYLTNYATEILKVTPSQIQDVMRKYVNLHNLTIVVVGDKSKIIDDLQYFAPVTVYDSNGKLVAGSK